MPQIGDDPGPTSTTYAFDNASVTETSQRFRSLEACYDPVTERGLADTGVRRGWTCLEVGAGTGSIAAWLGSQVGKDGSVVVTDIDTGLVDVAAENIEVRRHDIARDPLPERTFDLVHARLVLLHVPERRRALHNIWRALKPGGWLVLNEFDCRWLPVLRAPDDASVEVFDRVTGAVHALIAQAGADPAWGTRAYRAVVDTGFADVRVQGFCEAWQGGSIGAHLHRANVQQTGSQLIERDLVSGADIATFLDLIERPDVTMSSYLMLTTRGRRPADEPAPSRAVGATRGKS